MHFDHRNIMQLCDIIQYIIKRKARVFPRTTIYKLGSIIVFLNEYAMVSNIMNHPVLVIYTAHVQFLDKFEKNQFEDSTIKINKCSCFSTK